MVDSYLRRISEFDSITPLSLDTRAPGVYERPFLIEGNSILSTVFVESCDVGASVAVSYYDYTTGLEVGEVYQLNAHRTLTTSLDMDRISITKIHNKPIVKCVVSGGAVRFSVYITVVSSFASDLDNALKFQNQLFQILRDKGIPLMGLDYVANEFNFLSSANGILDVNLADDSDILTTQVLSGTIVVGTTPKKICVGSSAILGRKVVVLQPKNGKIFIGDSGVTILNGLELVKKDKAVIKSRIEVYAVAAANIDVAVIEGK